MCLFPKVFLQLKPQLHQYFKIELFGVILFKIHFCQQESTEFGNTQCMQYTKQICQQELTVHFNSLPVLNIYQYFA